jgi:hypothetical protein
VRYRLGGRIAPAITCNAYTTLPTFLTFEPVQLAAAAAGLSIERWLYSDADETALEVPVCQANWRPTVRELAAGPRQVLSVAESLAAFKRHILPMERAPGTRGKYPTHHRTILTWVVWKGALPRLLPLSDDLLRAFLWDTLAFEALLSVLRQAINAVLTWHDRLRLELPLSGKRAYKRLIHSLSRFQGVPRRIFFPIYAGAVKRLLSRKLPGHPACQGLRGGCAVCTRHLIARRNCLAGATSTVTCSRCAEAAGLQVCDLWRRFDELAGYLRFKGGAAVNVKIRKNDQFRQGHQPRLGVPRNPEYDIIRQLVAFQRDAGLVVQPGCTKRQHLEQRCPLCPPMFTRTSRDGRGFVTDRAPFSGDLPNMIVDGLRQVGFDMTLFSGISASRGGLSTAIEAGVPDHILWMQSGQEQDVAARRYVQLGSPALLYDTWAAFDL